MRVRNSPAAQCGGETMTYYQRNRARILDLARKYYEKNKEEIKRKQREKYAVNAEYRQYQLTYHREYRKLYTRRGV